MLNRHHTSLECPINLPQTKKVTKAISHKGIYANNHIIITKKGFLVLTLNKFHYDISWAQAKKLQYGISVKTTIVKSNDS